MKKILFIQNSLKTTYIFRKELISNLIQSGYEVDIFAPMDCHESHDGLLLLGANIIPLKNNKNLSFFRLVYANLKLFSLRKNYDVFVCFFIASFVVFLPFFLCVKSRAVVSIEGLGSVFSNSPILQRVLSQFLTMVKVRVFCNIDEKMILGQPNDFVSNGIGIDLLKFTPSKSKSLKSPNSILYVGRLIKDKGVLDAIDVLRRLNSQGFNCSLTLVGDIYESNPSSLSQGDMDRLKIEFGPLINFVGFQSDLVKYYQSATVLLLPSVREGFPVVVMEASACGLPTVSYDVPGSRDAIEHNINGFLVPYKDIQSLCKCIVDISEGWDDMKAFNCRIYAENNFDRNDRVESFTDILNLV